jgi:hypothetical protein
MYIQINGSAGIAQEKAGLSDAQWVTISADGVAPPPTTVFWVFLTPPGALFRGGASFKRSRRRLSLTRRSTRTRGLPRSRRLQGHNSISISSQGLICRQVLGWLPVVLPTYIPAQTTSLPSLPLTSLAASNLQQGWIESSSFNIVVLTPQGERLSVLLSSIQEMLMRRGRRARISESSARHQRADACGGDTRCDDQEKGRSSPNILYTGAF